MQLTGDGKCRLFGDPTRPAVCNAFQPAAEMCGNHRDHAILWLAALERKTAPAPGRP